jgi:uncharacterized protein YdiU (UPF0061 family)
MNFDNSYARLPERFYTRVQPAPAPDPKLMAWNAELAEELGLSALASSRQRLAQIFSGNELPDGTEPIALAYAGHQFGYFVPQLGDGRALLLGEVVSRRTGRRYDLQLKGSGQTPFSRRGDGKSSLGPVIREYILSEAMYHLGVPTTRALAAVWTGESVFRETRLPGGVFTRAASSHLRIGTFEYFAARRDLEALQTLADYAIERHYPEVKDAQQPLVAFFGRVVEAQASLVAQWMDIGFIHGVMNTDNTSISGETIDYGPCAFMDEFDFHKVFSSIDQDGRYAYSQQASIAQWNLARLAECLLRLGGEQALFEAQIEGFQSRFEHHYLGRLRSKLGLTTEEPDDTSLINAWLQYLQDHALDYTLSFRRLGTRLEATDTSEFGDFEARWKQRIANQPESATELKRRMDAANPLFIPRNHQVERAIQGAIAGDLSVFHELNRVLRKPFVDQPDFAPYAQPPQRFERVERTFCGT